MENIAVVEGHMVAIASEHNKLVLENDTGVTVTCSRSLAFNMVDLSFTLSTHHWGAFLIAHGTSHSLPFAHSLVIAIKFAVFVVLDQEGSLHAITSWRV